jgi:hypothetical protein
MLLAIVWRVQYVLLWLPVLFVLQRLGASDVSQEQSTAVTVPAVSYNV